MTAQVIGRVKLERVNDHARSMVLARFYAKQMCEGRNKKARKKASRIRSQANPPSR
jgi:hypothetical protein